MGGTSWHANDPIKLGRHMIEDPQWVTKPLGASPYDSVRVRLNEHEIEWLHDKVYMGYYTDDVRGFEISDGYNF